MKCNPLVVVTVDEGRLPAKSKDPIATITNFDAAVTTGRLMESLVSAWLRTAMQARHQAIVVASRTAASDDDLTAQIIFSFSWRDSTQSSFASAYYDR